MPEGLELPPLGVIPIDDYLTTIMTGLPEAKAVSITRLQLLGSAVDQSNDVTPGQRKLSRRGSRHFFTMSVSLLPFLLWYSFLPPAAFRFSLSIIAIACLRFVTFGPVFDSLCNSPLFAFPITSSQGILLLLFLKGL